MNRLLPAWLSAISHQNADANMFQFYRKGEWLTKEAAEAGRSLD